MTAQIVAKPQGIVTEPNKVGQFPPGAFSYVTNGALRAFGEVEQVRKFSEFSGTAFSSALVGGIYAVSDGPYTAFLAEVGALGSWTLRVYRAEPLGSVTTQSVAVSTPWKSYITNDARTGILISRRRVIVTGTVRSFAFDIIESTDGTTWNLYGPRNCGVYQTILYGRTSATGGATDPAYLAPNQHFSATSTLRMVHSDGYELVSPPAVPYDYANLSTTLPQIKSEWTTKADLTLTGVPYEHKIDIYRTRAQSVGYDSVNNKYIPVATGSSFYLSKTFPWFVNYATFFNISTDTTLPSTLGEALLTNVSVGGASALPLPPTPAKTCAVFRGHAFYANRWDPATFVLLNPYHWAFMEMSTASSAVLTQGIGIRYTTTGQTATSGSPTVTGLPNTTGVVAGQSFNVYRTDNGNLVTSNNAVLSKTATTVTGTTNVTYSGSVRVEFLDRIEINGIDRAASSSPQDFVSQLFFGSSQNLNTTLDVAAVGLEPITTENPAGVYPNFVPTGGLSFRMRTNSAFTIRATNGANFSPKLPELSETALSIAGKLQRNGFAWSENNEPENCPPSNYAFCGQGEIYKIIATRDCLWFFCSDGLFRLSGAGGSVGEEYDWVIDPVDPGLVICNPDCAVVMNEYVYAYTNRGFVSISSEGVVRQLSDGRINPSGALTDSSVQFGLPNRGWTTNPFSPTGISTSWNWLAIDQSNDEIWIRDYPNSASSFAKIWVYNAKTDSWMCRVPSIYSGEMPTLGIYNTVFESVLCAWANRTVITGSVGGTLDAYETMVLRFQPIYGVEAGAPYKQKHWQDINLSFRSPSFVDATCTVRSQTVSAGTRAIPTSTASAQQLESSRVGFTIPRAWPALTNAVTIELEVSSIETEVRSGVKLEGMSVSYIDFTTQRVRR